MASFTPVRGTRNEINAVSMVDGQFLYETDQGDGNRIYADIIDSNGDPKRVQVGGERGDQNRLVYLKDVALTNPQNNDYLKYDSVNQKWVNDGTLNNKIKNLDNNGQIDGTNVKYDNTTDMTAEINSKISMPTGGTTGDSLVLGIGNVPEWKQVRINVVDNLSSTSATDALSANQGRNLNSSISNLTTVVNQKVDAPKSAGTSGQVLGLDAVGNTIWKTVTGGGGSGSSDWSDVTNKPFDIVYDQSVSANNADFDIQSQSTSGGTSVNVLYLNDDKIYRPTDTDDIATNTDPNYIPVSVNKAGGGQEKKRISFSNLVDRIKNKIFKLSAVANGDFLRYDSTEQKWVNDSTVANKLYDIDNTTIIKNSVSNELEVPIDNNTIIVDSSDNKVKVSNNITTKLPKSVPTTADEGKAPVVQSDGTVDWQKVSGSGTARIDISHTADDVYYYNISEPTKQILVTGTSIDVGFGTYRFYQTDGSQKSEEQEVIVDTLKIYSVELSYFTAYITVNYPSYAKCLLTKGTTSINASNGVATVVPSDGVWSVKVYATNTAGEEVIGETSTVTIATDGQSETLTLNGLAKINLTWLSGFDSAITIENSAKGITYNGLLSGTSIIIPVNALGDWVIYGTHTGKQYKAKVTISSFGEEKSVYLKTSTTYAVHISMTEADPDNAVTFPSGYDNSDFSDNAYMNLNSGSFHYGDWADAFFMPRSCMLKFDGTVDYYLNEDDETKKEDGTPSDVANINYGGNAMVEWGKIYFGFKGDADGNGYTFIVSDYSDEGIDCYCNIDENKNEIDHFYTPKYFGSNDSSNRLRSISGQSNYVSQTGATELSHAKANGNGWSTECYGDWTLIKHLLVLMSKSLDTQGKYGYGRCSTSNSTAIGQGTMNGKGRFWGDSSQTNGVKVFGMENWYGNIWRRIEGYVTNSSGVQLVKMCYGTRDGSTADAYSTGGTGYVSMGTTSGTSGSGIQTMHVNDKCGVVPKALTGNTSPTTYFSDGHWYGNSCYAIVGGGWNNGLQVGAFCSGVDDAVSHTYAGIGAAVSCKPLSA